jgi:methyl-accepting chemotaxis protein
VTSPALDRNLLTLPSRLEPHAGTVAYLRRDLPYVTDDAVNALSNSLSILGALAGGGLFLWQWWRQRTRARRDETFGNYMVRVADVERRIATLELSATLELEPLAELQRELLELKSEALDRFAAGDLGDQAALSDLLSPINSARDHIGGLILHIRDNLEERAETEGRTATALWTEEIEKPETGGD